MMVLKRDIGLYLVPLIFLALAMAAFSLLLRLLPPDLAVALQRYLSFLGF
jgi:hypothetical protein